MAIVVTKVKINNQIADQGGSLVIPYEAPIITWDISTTAPSIKQLSYEIRIGSNTINWGTSSFISDVIRQPYARDMAQYWRLKNKFIQRGEVYYGQIRVKDTTNEESEWVKFSFAINRLPFLTSATISPLEPSETTDLELKAGASSESTTLRTKWFRNGVHYQQFDNYLKVSREYLRYGDSWYAEISPHDGLELGPTITVKAVTISKKPPVADNLQLLPLNPNVNDILEASYVANDPNTETLLIQDKSEIRWYINGEVITVANDERFVRFGLKPNDEVYFTVTPSDGIFVGTTVASRTVTIQDPGFRVINVRVDGLIENLSVNSVNPTIEWDVIQPFDRASRYAHIRLGTAPGSNNTYETMIETYDNKFSLPDNIVRRGVDYYVSVAMSDQPDLFQNAESARFRVAGNLWEKEVDNATGWTIELAVSVTGETGYQRISIGDGKRFAEIRFYPSKTELLLGKSNIKVFDIDMTVPHNILIVGKNNSIKVYAENSLILDGTDLFVEFASDRFIEIGSSGNSDATGFFKRVAYNINGNYEPGASIYSDIRLEKFIDFAGMAVSDITEHEGNILVAANPLNPSESGQIFKIVETEKAVLASTENIDAFSIKLNSLSLSPTENLLYIAHTKGASFFDSYYIPKYDNDSIFSAGFDPQLDLWELVRTTPFVAATYEDDGLVIDTTVGNRQTSVSVDNTTIRTTAKAISFVSVFDSLISYNFDIQITSTNILIIYLAGTSMVVYSTSLLDKSVTALVNELKALTDSAYYFFGLFYDIFVLNDVGTQAATRLQELTQSNLFPSLSLSGTYEVVDPYNPNPYGTLATGKWFYCHRKSGTPWFERVDNAKGWTVDFDFRLDSIEDSDTPANVEKPKGIGLYVNDGLCSENIYFLPQEIVFEDSGKSFVYDTTSLTQYRLIGKKTRIKLYGKKAADQTYNLIAETAIIPNATNQGNAGRPSITTDANGVMHAVWHDDGKGVNRRQLYYSTFGTSWSEPELIVSDEFSSENPDIAVDSLGNVYVVYETTRSDYTDISVITKNAYGWSEPYLLTSNLYDSFAPKISIDNKNNAHVVWEDYRLSHPQIFYCRRNAANGQWESAMFGGTDVQISLDAVGAKRPAIIAYNQSVFVTWTSFKRDGSSGIRMGVYDGGQKLWLSSGQNGTDYSVSGMGEIKADHSDVTVDLKGQIVVVWNDVVGYNQQVFGRFINSRLVFAKDVEQLTTGDFDSEHPRCGVDSLSGNVYVVFEKQQEKITSTYDPYAARESDVNFKSPSVYALRWNAVMQVWESSNQNHPEDYDFNFDVEFDFGLPRQSYRPIISDKFHGNLHILFESSIVVPVGEVEKHNETFTQVRDIVFDLTFEPVYDISSHSPGEIRMDGALNRKEIRFGDFSENLSARMVVGTLKYYLSDSVDPFSINLVSSATTNMPNTEVYAVAANNNGDAWLGTKTGLIFYKRDSNQTYLLDSENYNIKDLSIYGIAFDRKSNMHLATSNGLYVSGDHSYFFKLSGDLPATPRSIEVDDANRLYVASDSGIYIINLNNLYGEIEITKEKVTNTARTIAVAAADITKLSLNGDSSIKANVVRVDANDVAWIGTDQGLIRYASGEIALFTTVNGLNSNKVNDIAIRNTAIRYIATTAGVNKMTGISVSPLNFDNTNAPPSAFNQTGTGDIKIPVFNNTKAIKWKDPNVLWIASNHTLYEIVFIEEAFTTEKTEIAKFSSSDFTLTPVAFARNNDLQTFQLIGLSGRQIPKNALFEVTLNGNKITRGYTFSPSKQLIRFDYPLAETDVVKVNVRFDIEKLGNFSQNQAQKYALGNKATRIEKLLSTSGHVYALTGGDINTLQINDETTDLPFDRIVLDKTPPAGKITLGSRRERSVFEVSVAPLEDDVDGLFDQTSGIDKMIVSNYANFTSDGEVPLEPIVFTRFLLHNIGEIFDSVSRQYTFVSGLGRRMLKYQPIGKDPIMLAGTAEPANVYKYDPIAQSWVKIDTLDVVGGTANPNASVEFLIEFQGRIFAGTGSPNGSGKLWIMNNETFKFELLRTLPTNTYAHCAVVFDEVLYIGGGGGGFGALYSFDGTTTKEVFRNVSGAIYSLVESERELYAATGSEGRIYKLDPKNNTQQIVDVNADRKALSINKAVVNGQGYIFAGFGSSGQIKRSKIPDSPFVHSFKTIPSAVYAMKNIGGVLYAAIGNTLYYLDNVWTAKYTHREDIRDIMDGPDGTVWFISDSYIYKIGKAENVKKVYLKLIDKAGNETNLYTDVAQTTLDPNLFDEISISDLAAFINRNRILRVDPFGKAIDIREGNDRFYSADVVEEEQGEYYSEFFNGTNNLVSWDKISWDATIPDNTSVTFYIKTAATRDEILDKEFEFSVNGSDQSADISFLSGQYIQFKVVMKSKVRGLSPSLRNVVIKSISSDSTHFFTTNFVMPSRVKSGILTSTKLLPVAADIVFGIDTKNSTDFADYQIIDENRIFTTEDSQIGKGLRVGIRFITPTKSEAIGLNPDEYSPYGYPLMFNSVEWSYKNPDAIDRTFNFRISFYEDSSLTTLVYEINSANSHTGFSTDGNIFPTGGTVFVANQTRAFSFTPVGATPLRCSTYYYVKIEAISSPDTFLVTDALSFIESCGTTFVDNINFEFVNTAESTETFHFRIRFYNDPERTDLKYTAFSGNDLTNWQVNDRDLPVAGFETNSGESIVVNYAPSLSTIDANKTYYLSIDVYNGSVFENNSNSFTFKANDLTSQAYCGSYADVPILKNFSIMWELEGNEFISMRFVL
jgi:hypothetical protein